MACGTVVELAEQTREDDRYLTELQVTSGDERLVEILKNVEGVLSVGRQGGRYIVGSRQEMGSALAQAALSSGCTLVSLRPCGNDLDEIYRRYFEKAGHEDGSSNRKIKRFISRNR